MTQLEFLNLNQGREQPGWLRNISTNKVIMMNVTKVNGLNLGVPVVRKAFKLNGG